MTEEVREGGGKGEEVVATENHGLNLAIFSKYNKSV